ncbi:uncharacterized protein LOC142571896 isoform X2 [Dermacentor variabilis]|uniref:uncharacterized protein LOC142571896 isoform X2 n=1 Tax=Dermacentor variabilis TaxID=34621 RepID=UPI003F5C5807
MSFISYVRIFSCILCPSLPVRCPVSHCAVEKHFRIHYGQNVAEFMARLPSKGGAFIRKVCQNGGNLKELLPFLHTPDYLEEWKRASGTCGVKTS